MSTDMDIPAKPRIVVPKEPYPDERATRVKKDLARVLGQKEELEHKAEERSRDVLKKENAAKPRIQKFIERMTRMNRNSQKKAAKSAAPVNRKALFSRPKRT